METQSIKQQQTGSKTKQKNNKQMNYLKATKSRFSLEDKDSKNYYKLQEAKTKQLKPQNDSKHLQTIRDEIQNDWKLQKLNWIELIKNTRSKVKMMTNKLKPTTDLLTEMNN